MELIKVDCANCRYSFITGSPVIVLKCKKRNRIEPKRYCDNFVGYPSPIRFELVD